MASPLIRRRSNVAFAIETTPGTAESLVAADGVLNVYNAKTRPIFTAEPRDGQGALSQLPGVPTAYGGQITFETDFIGGSSAPDLWTRLWVACGAKQATGVIFRPESRPPEASSSSAECLTIGHYEDGRRKVLKGCMGTARIVMVAGQRVVVEFTFTGVWVDPPTDTALIAPTYLTTAPLRFVSSALSIGGVTSLRVGNAEFDLGNEVVLREDGSNSAGYHSAVITARRPTFRIDPEGQLVANYNAYGKFTGRTEEAITWSLGSSGNRVQASFPKAQIVEIDDGDRSGLRVDSILYQLNRSASAGEDEWAFTVD